MNTQAASSLSSPVKRSGAKIRTKTILVPTDFSTESRKALRYAAAFAESFSGQLILITVVEPPTYADVDGFPLVLDFERIKARAEAKLESFWQSEGVDPDLVKRVVIRSGQPFNEIVEEANAQKADLIVIATHGYTGLKHTFLGSTAERVVRHAKCPVLVVRENETEFVS